MPGIELLAPRAHDLGGGFTRAPPAAFAQRRAVGPFVFFDHFGPITATPADDHDVRPHPHIGLATVTYLFEGAMMHRDSTGIVQRIEPGAINWMTAGPRHRAFERTPDDLRERDAPQPRPAAVVRAAARATRRRKPRSRTRRPSASRRSSATAAQGARARRRGVRRTSPVAPRSPTLYLDIALDRGGDARLGPPSGAEHERAIYAVDAGVQLDGEPMPAQTMAC